MKSDELENQTLNADVAEKLFGWSYKSVGQVIRIENNSAPSNENGLYLLPPHFKPDNNYITIIPPLPDYCGDLNEAFKVVDKMKELGYNFILDNYRVGFQSGDSIFYHWVSVGDSHGEKIVIAALDRIGK